MAAPSPTRTVGSPSDNRFVDPDWIRSTSPSLGEVARVEGGRIQVKGRSLGFHDGPPPPDGSEVRVWLDPATGRLACRPEPEHHAIEAASASAGARAPGGYLKAGADRGPVTRDGARRAAAEEAWLASFDPPFRWETGRKPVVGGLTERSAGHGGVRSSVTHILLPEGAEDGRLRRDPGEMLCGPGRGSYGNEAVPGTPSCPTCRRCLQMSARYIAPPSPSPSGP